MNKNDIIDFYKHIPKDKRTKKEVRNIYNGLSKIEEKTNKLYNRSRRLVNYGNKFLEKVKEICKPYTGK